MRHALDAGLNVNVYSNLVRVTPPLWELLTAPGVSLSTSWHSASWAWELFSMLGVTAWPVPPWPRREVRRPPASPPRQPTR